MNDRTTTSRNLAPKQEAMRVKCVHPTGAFVEFTKEEVEQSIPNRFEKIVRQYPDRIAVKTATEVLTYGQGESNGVTVWTVEALKSDYAGARGGARW